MEAQSRVFVHFDDECSGVGQIKMDGSGQYVLARTARTGIHKPLHERSIVYFLKDKVQTCPRHVAPSVQGFNEHLLPTATSLKTELIGLAVR
ncbi:hypothetical protein GQ600_1372 [Phytophthora cactorum]|nr:hypothetical protein GQ600_1372 [Phytophthora cactorum]